MDLWPSPPSVLPDISPSRGEIALYSTISPIANVAQLVSAVELPISLPEGEMSGRTEGGACLQLSRGGK
jgi:hypothetical protein